MDSKKKEKSSKDKNGSKVNDSKTRSSSKGNPPPPPPRHGMSSIEYIRYRRWITEPAMRLYYLSRLDITAYWYIILYALPVFTSRRISFITI